MEGAAVCWFGRWSFHSRLDDNDEEPEDEDQEIGDKTLPRWQIWLAAERSRDHRHWRPWRKPGILQATGSQRVRHD